LPRCSQAHDGSDEISREVSNGGPDKGANEGSHEGPDESHEVSNEGSDNTRSTGSANDRCADSGCNLADDSDRSQLLR
jgi:hypothetical protein